MTGQECIRCSRPSGYNRLVYDSETGNVAGGFCRACELDLFGRTLVTVRFEDGSCTLCERDGFFLLAPWLPETRTDPDGTVTVTGEFCTDGNVPRLCDVHRHEVADPTAGEFATERQPRADGVR